MPGNELLKIWNHIFTKNTLLWNSACHRSKKLFQKINCFKNERAYQVRLPCKRAVLLPSSNYRPTCQATDKDPIIINWFTPKYGLKEDSLLRFDAFKNCCQRTKRNNLLPVVFPIWRGLKIM